MTRCFVTAVSIIAVGDNNLLLKGSYIGSGIEYSVRPVGDDFLYPLDKLIRDSEERTLFYVVQESTGPSK